jgi:C-terminal processing protease CtpA/Prc
VLALLISCEKDDLKKEKQQRLHVNEFIAEAMDYYYLWNDQIPNIRPDNSTDPNEYFKSLLYKDDIWSYITDDKDTFMEEEINQTGETFGYELSFGLFNNSSNVFAVVRYVYPLSPAAAVLKRGDIILKLNDQSLTVDNYTDLYKSGTIRLTLGTISGSTLAPANSVTLSSVKMERNPVFLSKTIEQGGHKIGYLVYTSFASHYHQSLVDTLTALKTGGITDLVLDLRYNSGGEADEAALLCSAIVPSAYANKDNILIRHRWNAQRQADLEELVKEEPAAYEKLLFTTFETVACNLELPSRRVYVLTTSSSASASEMLIVGLKPYMDVIQVGDTTHGKYTAMIGLAPTEAAINHWMILPVVYKFMNKDGYTDFKDGLAPDHLLEEALPFRELGDEAEPLLAKAISLITGNVDHEEDDLESVAPGREIRWLPLPAKRVLDGQLLHRLPGDARFPGR